MKSIQMLAEGPRPDFYREDTLSLNGEWVIAFDDDQRGLSEMWFQKPLQGQPIQVPFCYQSSASGIDEQTAHEVVWYQREISVPSNMLNRCLWLCFGAIDYEAIVWINGSYIGSHKGGHSPFSLLVDSHLLKQKPMLNISIRVYDPYDLDLPRGKQHWDIKTDRCWYTATTGIWQDVWLEAIDGTRILSAKITPDIDIKSAKVVVDLEKPLLAGELRWKLAFQDRLIRSGQVSIHGSDGRLLLDVTNQDAIDNAVHLWSCDHPDLYSLELELVDNGIRQDLVQTYFGMRKIERMGDKILLNHQPLVQRLVLDQGYWPDTLMTPPSDEALIRDIELTKSMGFNGVRKHQKAESPKYLYYADVAGLLVWSEMPSNYNFSPAGMKMIIDQWQEIIARDYNHPCIITWVPFNESWGIRDIKNNKEQQDFAVSAYHLTKSLDPTRLVSTNDGWEMVTSDLCSIHDYKAQGADFLTEYKDRDALLNWMAAGKMLYADGFAYAGEPVLISEFGGIAFEDGKEDSWGYNEKVSGSEQFLGQVAGLVDAIEQLEYPVGYCYTQLTDVEQETNGLLDANRKPKVPLDQLRAIFDKNYQI